MNCPVTLGIRQVAASMAALGKCPTAQSPSAMPRQSPNALPVPTITDLNITTGVRTIWMRHKKLKESAGIFVGSMADLFGHWVPEEQIDQVIDVMREAHWHTFQTLSKFPIEVARLQWPVSGKRLGRLVSLPAGHLMSETGGARALGAYMRHMRKIDAAVRFMSIEPLWFDVAPVFQEWLESGEALPFEWVIIGAASNGSKIYQPEQEWTESLIELLDDQNIPIFFKGNLEWDDWRDEFPHLLQD